MTNKKPINTSADRTGAERSRRKRRKKQDQGLVNVLLWIPPSWKNTLKELARHADDPALHGIVERDLDAILTRAKSHVQDSAPSKPVKPASAAQIELARRYGEVPDDVARDASRLAEWIEEKRRGPSPRDVAGAGAERQRGRQRPGPGKT